MQTLKHSWLSNLEGATTLGASFGYSAMLAQVDRKPFSGVIT
jgi:hypothetical protein